MLDTLVEPPFQRSTPTPTTQLKSRSVLAETPHNLLPRSHRPNINASPHKSSLKRSGETPKTDPIKRLRFQLPRVGKEKGSFKDPKRSNASGRADSADGRKTVTGFFQSLIRNGSKQRGTTTADPKKSDSQPCDKGTVNQQSPLNNQNHESPATPCPRKNLKENIARRQVPAKPQVKRQHAKANDVPSNKQKPMRQKDPWYTPPGVVWELQDDATDQIWKTPTLCKDSFVTYAEDGVWRTTMEKAGYLRQVPAMKQSHFEEDEVVFATRYFLC
jgi:hypothetical protein